MKKIKVCLMEFVPGGNTIWIHNDQGCTVLRIQCTGNVKVKPGCENICAHADMVVLGDIEVCIPSRKKKVPGVITVQGAVRMPKNTLVAVGKALQYVAQHEFAVKGRKKKT